jgi:hypothetical protein
MPTIHLATLIDLPSIRLLWKAMAQEVSPLNPYPANPLAAIDTFTRSVALALSQQPPTVFFFLGRSPDALTDDAFLAYEIQVRQLGEPSKMGFIHYCYVAPSARTHGMATQLGLLTMEHMAAQGLTHVEITTAPGRTTWADLGFIPFEERQWATVARVTVGLEDRTKRAILATSNGLDTAPLSAPQEDDDAPA